MKRAGSTRLLAAGCVVLALGFANGCGNSGESTPAGGFNSFRPFHGVLEGPVYPAFLMRLTADLSFIDSKGKVWIAPKGTVTDGASIPQIFLSFVGDRFSKEFLDAAIVHDAYCGRGNEAGASYHKETWRDVHRMFYGACLANGTSPIKAKLMYAGVYLGGPRWNDPAPSLSSVPKEKLQEVFEECKEWIEENDPTLDTIDKWMDVVRQDLVQNKGQSTSGNGAGWAQKAG